MSKLKRCTLIVLLCLIYATTALAQDHTGGIEFNGRIYRSFDDVIDVAMRAAGAQSVEDIFLACGPRMTVEVLERGYYDFRYDIGVCFTNERESDQLYADNQRLMASYPPVSPPDVNLDNVAYNQRHVCTETPRGTAFRHVGYNGAFDDVCPSHRRSSLNNFVKSYWQVGEGKTYFYFFSRSNLHWWLLDSSAFVVDGQMRGWRIARYSWGRDH